MPNEQVFPKSTKTEGNLGTYTATTVGGLTKRELFAGLIFACRCINLRGSVGPLANDSVELADMLVEALEE